MAASISLTVVLPLLPATPITGPLKRARAARAALRHAPARHSSTTDLRQRRMRLALHDGASRACGCRGGDVLVAVDPLAMQRREQIAGAELARIDGELVEFAVRADQPAVTGGRKLRQRADHARAPRAQRGTAPLRRR